MSSSSSLHPLDVVDYRPGVCNIGPEEIARRRLSGHIGLVASVAVFVVLVAIGAPGWTRLILVLTAGGSASGYLQAWLHFCAGFGSRGVFNFGPVGVVQAVADPQARSRDRVKALEIGLASLVVGLAVGIGAALLPIG